MPNALVNGTDLHHELVGDGEPFVLLNGILMSTVSWAPVATLVARRHRVLLHDFRGQLESANPAAPWSMSQHAEDPAANPGLVELTARRLGSLPRSFFDGFSHLVGAFMDLDLKDRLPRIDCATMVVAADEGRLKPVSASRAIADAIPGARLVTVAGAGHAVVVEQPQLVAALVLGLMATRPATAPAG